MRASLALGAALLLSCRTPTQITFEVTTDIACAEHQGTSVSVGRLSEVAGRPFSSSQTACDPATGRIGSVVVVPSGDADEEVAVRFVLGIGKSPERCVDDGFKGGCVVASRALRFIAHEPLVVSVPMRNECRDVECPAGQTCARGACVGARIEAPSSCVGSGCGEEAVAGATPPGDGGVTDAALPAGAKRVFVTSALYSADLGGALGADAKCTSLATVAKLRGTFKAWVSDKTTSPSARFSRGGPYVLLDGTVVANDWTELTKGPLRHAIDLTEKRTPVVKQAKSYCGSKLFAATWTGTTVTGESSGRDECLGFTTGAPSHVTQSVLGDPTAVDAAWTNSACLNAGATYCAFGAALYCFEQ